MTIRFTLAPPLPGWRRVVRNVRARVQHAPRIHREAIVFRGPPDRADPCSALEVRRKGLRDPSGDQKLGQISEIVTLRLRMLTHAGEHGSPEGRTPLMGCVHSIRFRNLETPGNFRILHYSTLASQITPRSSVKERISLASAVSALLEAFRAASRCLRLTESPYRWRTNSAETSLCITERHGGWPPTNCRSSPRSSITVANAARKLL